MTLGAFSHSSPVGPHPKMTSDEDSTLSRRDHRSICLQGEAVKGFELETDYRQVLDDETPFASGTMAAHPRWVHSTYCLYTLVCALSTNLSHRSSQNFNFDLPPFPMELWVMIFEHVLQEGRGHSTLKTLCQCARVCRTFERMVHPHLVCNFKCGGIDTNTTLALLYEPEERAVVYEPEIFHIR